jgi:AcrR family transcriptional regulator
VTKTANEAFVHALNHTVIVGAVIALAGAVVALVFLPARPVVADEGLEDIQHAVVTAARRLPSDGRRRVSGVVFQLLAEAGFSSLTFNGVATRSGVSTATLERSWGSRIDMVVDAVRAQTAAVPIPDSGSFRTDAERYLDEVSEMLGDPQTIQVIGQLIASGARDAELADALRTRLLMPRRVALVAMIDRGVERGELAPDTDREILADMLVAPLYHRALVSGQPIDDDVTHRIVEAVMHANHSRTTGG